jgi:hypothetical protein
MTKITAKSMRELASQSENTLNKDIISKIETEIKLAAEQNMYSLYREGSINKYVRCHFRKLGFVVEATSCPRDGDSFYIEWV